MDDIECLWVVVGLVEYAIVFRFVSFQKGYY